MKKSISILMALALFGACDDDNNITDIGVEGETVVFSTDIVGIDPFVAISGTADVTTVIGDDSFDATVTIVGDTSGLIRPWRVREGTCANSSGVVGNNSDYPDLVVGADGTGSVTVVVPHELDPDELHHIEFYVSPDQTDPDTDVIACGDLVLQ